MIQKDETPRLQKEQALSDGKDEIPHFVRND